MLSLVRVLNGWEIQLLVLLSFALQVFLFFTGGLRRRSISSLLRFSMWVAYLGADLVAVYVLGFLSRHKDVSTGKETLREAHPLAFLWASFLLVHLGGQDTITAFAIQDNDLWLRHLLNLVVQVVVALYVFWVSMTGHDHRNVQLPGIFVFIAGIIKYGERTLALMYGNIKSSSNSNTSIGDEIVGYLGIVASALKSSGSIRELLTFAWLLMAHKNLGNVGDAFNFNFSYHTRPVLFIPHPSNPEGVKRIKGKSPSIQEDWNRTEGGGLEMRWAKRYETPSSGQKPSKERPPKHHVLPGRKKAPPPPPQAARTCR